jgi:uncharacterized membrane protein
VHLVGPIMLITICLSVFVLFCINNTKFCFVRHENCALPAHVTVAGNTNTPDNKALLEKCLFLNCLLLSQMDCRQKYRKGR